MKFDLINLLIIANLILLFIYICLIRIKKYINSKQPPLSKKIIKNLKF